MVTPLLEGEVTHRDADAPEPSSLRFSRAMAVHRVFRGGIATAVGAVLTGVGILGGAASGAPFALSMAGFALGGLGLVEMSRAASHFLKYGSRGAQVAFLATAGLGASSVLAGLSNWLGVTFGGEVWRFLVHWSMNGVYTFGVIVLLGVLRALVPWVLDSGAVGDG